MAARIVTAVLDQTVAPVAVTLLECLTAELAAAPDPPPQVMYRVGVTVELLLSMYQDECCPGLGWVRLVQVYPSDLFPDPNTVAGPCSPLRWAAVLEMGVARCAPMPAAEDLPLAEAWNELAEHIFADGAAMRRALCCWAGTQPDRLYLPGVWEPLPVQGGCVGGTQQVTVSVDACDCP